MQHPGTEGAVEAGSRVVTPTFVVAWLVNFAQYLTFYLLTTTMALYAVRQFGAGESAAGFAASSFVVGATAARVVAGHVVDSLGRRRVLLASLVVVTLACLAYLPTASLGALVALRMVHGAAYALASTAVMTLVQSVIPPSRRAEGTGYFALGTTLATALGPALGLLIVDAAGYPGMFWATAAVAALGLVFGLVLRIPDTPAAARPHLLRDFRLGGILHPAVLPIGVFMLLVGVGYAGVITYLNGYAEERGLTAGAGLFFLAYAAVMLVMRFVLGRLQDRRGDNIVVGIGVVAFAASLVVLAVARQDAVVVLAGALAGLGYGTLMPAAQAIAVRLVPPTQLGTGISTVYLGVDVGIGLGPVALGGLLAAAGYLWMYLVLAAVVAVAGVQYALVHGRTPAARPVAAG